VREIKSAGNLVADVEGDIEDERGVMRITKIHLRYRIKVPADKRQTVERLMDHYADQCPAYQSVKGCINCTWDIEMQ
jgi:uncharacterized OsmC-like protein